ncbi:hypothetical protein [Streptomyces cyaneofuscatus]|uniref:hypothetical protein n=1 Tax=Streptomyces cyaneofuscatus TaxID=66883 RepID=UPI003830AA03
MTGTHQVFAQHQIAVDRQGLALMERLPHQHAEGDALSLGEDLREVVEADAEQAFADWRPR